MKHRLALLALAGLCGLSCGARRTATVRRPAPPAARGIVTTFERHITNARDAGEGDYRLRTLRERMAAEPANLEVRLELARHYLELGATELALEHYRLAEARFPDSVEVQTGLLKCLRALRRTPEAVQGLEKFLQQRPPSTPELVSWLGILRDELGRLEQGEAAHRQALALAPNQDRLHNNLGYNLLQQKRQTEAVEEFRKALALRPDSIIARNNLELAQWDRPPGLSTGGSQQDKAGALSHRHNDQAVALKYDRNHPAALRNLSLIAELDGQPAQLPSRRASPAWKRFLSALWRGLAGIEKRQPAEAASTASP